MARYREYTVAMSAVYTVVVCAEDMWSAEDLATDMLDAELKKNRIEEPDYFIVDEHQHHFCKNDDEYEIKIKANMVVPIESTNYEQARQDAVQYIEDTIKMPEEISLETTEDYDVTIAREKAFLQRSAS